MLWEYDKVDDKIREVGVMDAGVVSDFYTLQTPAGPDTSIDDVLARIENRAAPALQRLADASFGPLSMSLEDRWTISLYTASLCRRVPAAAAAFQKQVEALRLQWTIDLLKDPERFHATWRAEGRSDDRETAEGMRLEWLDLLEKRGYRFVADGNIGLAGIGSAPNEALHIAMGTWTLLKRTRHPLFLIGDAPVKLLSPHPSAAPIFEPTGPGIRWQVPLTPSTALVVRPPQPGDNEAVVGADAADPTLDQTWCALLPDGVASDAGFFHDLIAWRYSERWVWARDKADLERIGAGFTVADRRMRASELHRTSGFVRATEPQHVRAILDYVAQRRAASTSSSA